MLQPPSALTVTPIGVVHSPFGERSQAPRQPRAEGHAGARGTVELFAGHGFEDALSDLALWDHVWLITWFDRNRGFRPKVAPPRSEVKRGLFATRAPYRPNPIGISALRLLGVEGLILNVEGLDLLDGTPVLDIKPYVPYTDAIPDANHGWLDPGEPAAPPSLVRGAEGLDGQGGRPRDPRAAYEVAFEPLARAQLDWLRDVHGVALEDTIASRLALGPSPHAYRRIKQDGDGLRLALKDWRAWFRVDGPILRVERIASGYRARELASGQAPPVHLAFAAHFRRGA